MTEPFNSQTILLVEDNPDDVFILRRAMNKAGIVNPVQLVIHGRQAIEYLDGVGDYANRRQYPLPASILLDLKLPFRHGFEVLEWIRRQPRLSRMSVVILTSSAEHRDLVRASELGAMAYLVKPPTLDMIREMMAALAQEWTGNLAVERLRISGDRLARRDY